MLYRLGRVDVLIVDDWAMAPLTDIERRDFLEICDERYQTRSTMLTSQLAVAAWHAQIGDPTVADSILDRLVHNAHRLELNGNRCGRSAEANRMQRTSREPGFYSADAEGRGLNHRPLPSALPIPADRFQLTDGDQFSIMKLSSVASLRTDRHHAGIVIDIRSECLIGIIGIRSLRAKCIESENWKHDL
jgi:hypothetical protein